MINLRGQRARRKEWATQVRMALAFERGLTSKLRREFKLVGVRAGAEYEESQNFTGEKAHAARLAVIVRPYALASFKTFWIRVKQALGDQLERKYTEEQLDKMSAKYIKDWVQERVTEVSKTTANKISKAINEGRANDRTHRQIARDIEDATGGEIGDARARTIARTEIHSATQAGSLASAEDADIPGLKKEWLTVGDERVRQDHADADGQRQELDEPFDIGGESLMQPGDPTASPDETINCRCVLTYSKDK